MKYEERLSKEQEIDLCKQMDMLRQHNNDMYYAIRNLIFERNLWIVGSIAKKFSNKTVDIEYDEMFSAGCIGLFEALEKFDTKYNVRVSTYAYPRIFIAIWDMVIAYRSGINVPKSLYKAACSHMKHQNITDAEFAKKHNLSLMELQSLISITRIGIPVLSSFEMEMGDGEKADIDSILGEHNTLDSNTSLTHISIGGDSKEIVKLELKIIGEQVDEYCKKYLTKKQYLVLGMTIIPYLKGEEYMTFAETARKLNQSLQSVDQLLDYTKIRLLQSDEGFRIKKIIWHTADCIKHKRSVKEIKDVLSCQNT